MSVRVGGSGEGGRISVVVRLGREVGFFFVGVVIVFFSGMVI